MPFSVDGVSSESLELDLLTPSTIPRTTPMITANISPINNPILKRLFVGAGSILVGSWAKEWGETWGGTRGRFGSSAIAAPVRVVAGYTEASK